MRALAGSLALALALGTGAWAQRGRGGGAHGGGMGGPRGGGVAVGGVRGGQHGGRGFVGVHRGSRGFGFGHSYRGFYIPYAWPSSSSYSSYPSYVWDYGYGYPSAPLVNPYAFGGYGYGYAAPPSAPVVISQSYYTPATPVIRVYQEDDARPAPPPPERPLEPPVQAQGPIIYLIAFRDGLIRPALAYWTGGANLHYLGMDHKEKQAALATVDRDFSMQLNRERRVPFVLPE